VDFPYAKNKKKLEIVKKGLKLNSRVFKVLDLKVE